MELIKDVPKEIFPFIQKSIPAVVKIYCIKRMEDCDEE